MRRPLTALLAMAALTSGCGYIGSPLPPLANIPAKVTGLAAVERSNRIIVHFTLPVVTTENFPIKTDLTLDLRISTAVAPFRAEDWAAKAVKIPEVPPVGTLATYEISTKDWVGKEITLGARVIAENGKASAWSDFVNLTVVPAPPAPSTPRLEPTAQGVRVSWDGPAGDFRIYRRSADEKNFARVGDAQQSGWVDTTSEFGKQYIYIVQRIVKLEHNQEAESDVSPEASITTKDTFPPAVPAGLRASAAPASVELSWERNTDADLAGYRIYRADAGGEFHKIADLGQVPSYSDTTVEHGKTYRYAVTAFDQSNNESARSSPAEASVP